MSKKKHLKANDKTKKKELLAAKERRRMDMRKKERSFLFYAYPPNLIHEVRLYGSRVRLFWQSGKHCLSPLLCVIHTKTSMRTGVLRI